MSGRRGPRGLAARFLLAQLLVVGASVLAAVLVASVLGPPLFHEHLMRADVAPLSSQLLHVDRAYRDAGLWTLGAGLVVALALAATVSWFLARRIRGSLRALADAASAVAAGRYGARVPSTGAGAEVDALAEAFNTMAARLDSTERTRRRLIADLAHEMRTPVSVLAVYRDALDDGVAAWDETTATVVSDQLARLTRLVEDMHDVSRAEEAGLVADPHAQPLGPIVRSAAEAHREAYAARGVDLEADVRRDAAVVGDRDRLGQVLDNLLTNALRHTPAGGRVRLTVDDAGPCTVAVSVADTGDGIPAEQLPHVFERFYRGDTARDRDHGGSGVGLAISRALAEAHGGTLTARSDGPGRGAVFTLALPTAPGSPGGRGPTQTPFPPPQEDIP
ncbi:HAMP domain-containing histidine kinase [Citricoccus sp. SGAir0253]|uniref:sensor histidine kinase n=1 Tax=Citricoccus sp. SGAir0253 TaxID=2567881 RepID=UPI0010CCCBF3|nr:HAMP domain-containing sensor histidine kinase [Citricoccus sp. SGAir0253]QCU79120.1 HAMP domain-containing histidine kinase [Citricoccus sp. SGAir0253]